MTTLGSLIQQHANDDANSSNWAAVAATLNAATVPRTSAGTLTSMARTLAALTSEEREPTLAAFDSSHVGKSGLAKLAAVGLDFAHPITVGLINSLSGQMPAGVPAKLLALGNWMVSPAANAGLPPVTNEQCQMAWSEYLAERAALQTAAKRSACRAAVRSINADSLIPESGNVPDLDATVAAIRTAFESFGAWG